VGARQAMEREGAEFLNVAELGKNMREGVVKALRVAISILIVPVARSVLITPVEMRRHQVVTLVVWLGRLNV